MRTKINHNQTFLVTVSTFAILLIIMFLNFQPVYSKNPEVSYLDVNDTSSVSKFSVASWFKTSNNFKSDAFIVNKAGDGGNMNYGIWMTDSEKIGGGFENSNGKRIYATSPLSYNDGNWHYAMVTFDDSVINLYVDGVKVAKQSTSESPDNGGNEPVRVGANSEQPDDYFVGDVDEVRVWKRALTPQEAANSYAGSFDTKGQILYLDFSEPIVPVNNTAINASSINGTTINGTTIISASLNGTSLNATEIKEFNPNSTLINETDIQGNATATNETGFEAVNETGALENATDQTDIQGINETATNETSKLLEPVIKNDTDNANGTEMNIQRTEPQNTNETGIIEEPAGNQTSKPLEVENNSPEAFDQSVSVQQDGQVDITLVASDEDNDPLQFDLTADPLQGSIDKFDKEKGTLSYVPQQGYSGNDEFKFRVLDDKGSQSNIALVDINVEELAQSNENQNSKLTNTTEGDIANQTGRGQDKGINSAEQLNQVPKADAGNDQNAEVNTEVKLDGGKSSDDDGQIVSYKWEQTDGPGVDLKQANEQTASFDVPQSAADSKLSFKLTVVDDKDASSSDDVNVDIEKISQDDSSANDQSNDKGKPN